MTTLKRLPVSLLVALLLPAACPDSARAAASIRWTAEAGDTIAFLGNTFAEGMNQSGWFESVLQARYPDHQLRIRNMAWSADTVDLQPRPYQFGDLDPKLSLPQDNPNPREVWFNGIGADSLILFFGMVESYRGEAGLAPFRKNLDAYLGHHLAMKYNGKTAPRLLLVGPIAHENLGAPLPNGQAHNRDLEQYNQVMREVAGRRGVPFLDLFTPHREWMTAHPDDRLTFNGIHPTDYGYWVISQWMARQLGWLQGPVGHGDSARAEKLRRAVLHKNDRFWIHFRAVNGEYIYGRRREIWAQKVPMIPDDEMRRLGQVDEKADRKIWTLPKPPVAEVWSSQPLKPAPVPKRTARR